MRGAELLLRRAGGEPDEDLSAFYTVKPENPELAWCAHGAGRMLRAPTVFEDVVKTVCTTNTS